MTASEDRAEPVQYAIEVDGIVDPRWSEWFGDLEVTLTPSQAAPGRTTLLARLPDQSALPALLARVTGLNLKVVSVTPNPEMADGGRGPWAPNAQADPPIRAGGSNGQ